MSELPVVDALKIAQREAEHLRQYYFDALHREAQLEILAEALRDQRDAAVTERDKAQHQLSQALASNIVTDPDADTIEGEVIG